MTTEERGNMTIEQFTAKYGWTFEDIKQLGWMRREGSFDAPIWHCIEGNDCPASLIFFDPVWLSMPEVRNVYAGVLNQILQRYSSEKALHTMGQPSYGWAHCFVAGDIIYCTFRNKDSRLEFDSYEI